MFIVLPFLVESLALKVSLICTGNKYWRYFGNRIDYGYPRELKVWRGLPKVITAAFQWKNGRTYFFSGDKYYRYNDQIFDVGITFNIFY